MDALPAQTKKGCIVPLKAASPPAWHWAAVGLLWLTSIYLWVVPQLVPRGDWFWGRYQARDLLLGVPVGLLTLCATAVIISPARAHREVGLRMVAIALAGLFGMATFEAASALGHPGIWRPNVWWDDGGVNPVYNVFDPQLGYKRKPFVRYSDEAHKWYGDPRRFTRCHEFYTDWNGYRNPPGIRRADIVFIGDSFTEASETRQPDTYVQRVGAASGLKVVNLGVGGYGPQQEFITLQRYGLAYKPRYVIWQIFGGNDLRDAERFPGWIAQPEQSKKTTVWSRYLRASPLIRMLDRTLPAPTPPTKFDAVLHATDGTAIPIEGVAPYSPRLPERYPLGWAETQRVVKAGFRLCRSHGIQLVVFFVPTREQVLSHYLEFQNEKARQMSLPGGVWTDPHDFGHRLGAFCRQIGCPFIDTLPALRARAAQDNRYVYFPANPHLDVEGHAVVAQLLLGWLRHGNRT